MKLGFLILAHDNPANVARLIKLLLESGSTVCLHYDLKGGDAPMKEINALLGDSAGKLILARRVRVSWGEWSIAEATLNGLAALFESGEEVDYIHLMSGADYPIRPISEFSSFLERQGGVDFIESHAVARKQWVKDGLSRERFQYRHFFNFKTHPRAFQWCWKTQAALKIKRKAPAGLPIHMGSQWWTLSAATCKYVLERGSSKDVVCFFRHSWIPDEMFVQTLAAQTGRKHSNRHLTLYQFNDYGVPIVFYDRHADYLSRQPFFFARKLSPYAAKLRDELDLVVKGEKSTRHFLDPEIGSPTREYESYKGAYRKGIPGRRLPGQIPPGHLGDLAWSNLRYLVLVGTSTCELDQAATLIRQIPNVICHGYLFGRGEIDFAEGAKSVAGYPRRGMLLRDHSQSTFLADVINAHPDKTTCFLLKRHDANWLLKEVICCDPNASVMILEGGVLRAYAEASLPVTSPGTEIGDRSTLSLEAAKIEHFQRELQAWIEGIPRRESSEAVSFHKIDILQPYWPRRLIEAVLESGVEVRQTASVIQAYGNRVKRPPAVDTSLAAALLSHGQRTGSRRRVLSEILAPEKPPYMAIVSSSRVAAGVLAAQLSDAKCFSLAKEQPSSVLGLVQAAMMTKAGHDGCPVVFVYGPDDYSLVEALLLDPDARIVALDAGPENCAIPGPNTMELSSRAARAAVQEAWEEFVQHLSGAAGPALVVNVHQGDWRREVARFVAGYFPALSSQIETIEKALSGTEVIAAGADYFASDNA